MNVAGTGLLNSNDSQMLALLSDLDYDFLE